MDTYKLSMTLVLALIAIPALVRNAARARLLVWVFNVEGTLDLFAITLATIYRAQPYMGAAYWIPAFWVPGLLVTHYITFVFLWKYWKELAIACLRANRKYPQRDNLGGEGYYRQHRPN